MAENRKAFVSFVIHLTNGKHFKFDSEEEAKAVLSKLLELFPSSTKGYAKVDSITITAPSGSDKYGEWIRKDGSGYELTVDSRYKNITIDN